MRTLRERLLSRAIIDWSTGCWEWSGAKNGSGYGTIKGDVGTVYVHRAAYELLVGPIPDGLQLDHLCRNRVCCNAAHLEPVTPRINNMRGESVAAVNARKTHCSAGHEFDLLNTYFKPNGNRDCRACKGRRAQTNQAARMSEAA